MIRAPGMIIREARERAGLTQSELARRMNTSQPVIARLERSASNPRMSTFERAIAATGHALDVSLTPTGFPAVDESMTWENLMRTPGERLQRFTSAYYSIRELAPTVRKTGGP